MNKLIGGIALLFLVGGADRALMLTAPGASSTTPRPIIAASTASSSAMRPYAGWVGRAGPIFSRTSVTAGRQDDARQQADVTDPPDVGSRPRRKARQRSIEHVMEVLGNAPSSHQPTFCSLARCRRPWPQRRGGSCGSVQQQDRAIRAGGAPVRGKPERRADGAAIDWRTARSPADACLDQTRRGTGESRIRGNLGARQASR